MATSPVTFSSIPPQMPRPLIWLWNAYTHSKILFTSHPTSSYSFLPSGALLPSSLWGLQAPQPSTPPPAPLGIIRFSVQPRLGNITSWGRNAFLIHSQGSWANSTLYLMSTRVWVGWSTGNSKWARWVQWAPRPVGSREGKRACWPHVFGVWPALWLCSASP